jgi:hypothetical protein
MGRNESGRHHCHADLGKEASTGEQAALSYSR